MKSDARKSVIITEIGEGLKRPDNVPEELWGEPEFWDWRSKAFALQEQIFRLEQERASNLRQIDLWEQAVEDLRSKLDSYRSRVDVRVIDALSTFLAAIVKRLSDLIARLRG